MGRSSCISEPENEPLILVKKWMVDISIDEKGKANHCAATLIGFFKYFHEVKIEISAKNTIANDVAEKHGEKRVHDESLYQFHTIEDLGERLLGFFSKNTIRSAISLLVEKGIIKTFSNPNPRYKFDKTTFFLFSPKNCKELLKNRRKPKPETIESQNWNIDGSELTDRYSKNDPTSSKSDPAIPKTTSKTTEEEAKQKIYQEDIAHEKQKLIESAAANFLVSENETENNNTDCQAQSPIAEQPSVAEKNIENAEQGSSEIVTTPQKVNLGVAAEQANSENRQNDEAQNNAQAQHGEVAQETKPQPSHSHRPEKPMVQKAKNAKASNVVEPVIGKSLTDGQIAALGRLAEIINTAKPELGVTTQDLARTILNPRAFRECRDQFLKKCNTIKKMALAGRWSPSEAQKPSANRNHWSPDSVGARHSVTAAVSDSTNPALMNMRHRESVDGRVSAIQNSIASIKSTFSDRMSKHRGRQFFVGQMNAIEEKKSMLLELGVDPAEVERLCDVSDLVRNLPQMQENITQFPVMSESTQMHRQAVGVGK